MQPPVRFTLKVRSRLLAPVARDGKVVRVGREWDGSGVGLQLACGGAQYLTRRQSDCMRRELCEMSRCT